jgi:hypothetical protein
MAKVHFLFEIEITDKSIIYWTISLKCPSIAAYQRFVRGTSSEYCRIAEAETGKGGYRVRSLGGIG